MPTLPRINTLRAAYDYEKLPISSPSSSRSSASSRSSSSSSSSLSNSSYHHLRLTRSLNRVLAFVFVAAIFLTIYISTRSGEIHIAITPSKAVQDVINDMTEEPRWMYVDNSPYIQKPWKFAACRDWDPERPESEDDEDCDKARMYRQVQRVLAREEKGHHHHISYYFTQEANIKALKRLLQCFLPDLHPDNRQCPNRPAIINAYYWGGLTVVGGHSGEAVWMESVIKHLDEQGIISLFMGPYENWITVAEIMPDVYRFIWTNDIETVSCISDPRCIAAEHYVPPTNTPDLSAGVPSGERGIIPVYRLFTVDWWGVTSIGIAASKYWWNVPKEGEWSWHPLGNQWVGTPWPLPGHVHLAFSIEDHCLQLPPTPSIEKTEDVLILAKQSEYFHMPRSTPSQHLIDLAKHFHLITAAKQQPNYPIPARIEAIGFQERAAYEQLVASSRVMLGIGHPPISPSVYTSLCQGTPIVLPHFDEKKQDQDLSLELMAWETYASRYQHGPAMTLGPPYVYSYYYKNYTQLETAVRQAHERPIERYIPDNMRVSFARKTITALLDRNLKTDFMAIVQANDGALPAMPGHVLERCQELKRCMPALPLGRLKGVDIPSLKPGQQAEPRD